MTTASYSQQDRHRPVASSAISPAGKITLRYSVAYDGLVTRHLPKVEMGR